MSQEGSEEDEEKVNEKPHTKKQLIPARTVPEHVQKAIKLVESQLMARNAQMGLHISAAAAAASVISPGSNNYTQMQRSRFDVDPTGVPVTKPALSHTATSHQLLSANLLNNTSGTTSPNHQQHHKKRVLKRGELFVNKFLKKL